MEYIQQLLVISIISSSSSGRVVSLPAAVVLPLLVPLLVPLSVLSHRIFGGWEAEPSPVTVVVVLLLLLLRVVPMDQRCGQLI